MESTMRHFTVAAPIALAMLALPVAAQRTPAPLAGFDAYVTKSMATWEVPGLAIAVVKGDSVVYAKGYGTRTIGKTEPVDPSTLFAIGSSSKAFTAALVAMLVDAGKVRWNDPVTQHLRGFQVNDPYVTREMRVRDLLSHRSGLARGDLLWYGTDRTRDQIVEQVRYLKPSWSLRSQFGYQNIMYIAAGQLAAEAMDMPWDEAIRAKLFEPLGMRASSTSINALQGKPNVASPHATIEDTVVVIPWRNIDNAGPAGSINSSVLDMAKWVKFQLDSGKAGGKTLLSTGSFVETHMPHTIIRREAPARASNPYTNFASYGLGWFLEDYRGREIVHHGGNIDGMSAMVGLMPGEDLGVVILTNMNGTDLTTVLMRTIFDRYLGVSGKDWSADLRKLVEDGQKRAKEAEAKRDSARMSGTTPSLPLAKYAGTYYDSLYGRATVQVEEGHLVARFGGFVGDMEHWHHDTFRATARDKTLGRMFFTFALNPVAEVVAFEIDGGPGANPEERPDFRRSAPPVDSTAAVTVADSDLQKLTGSYELSGQPMTIAIEFIDGTLKATVPGQPVYTLVAETPLRYRLTGPPGMPAGFFVEFEKAGDRVTSLTLTQPEPRPTLKFIRKAE
jgi:CubicO group peptidase (beta-lactamase class C family)